jgi:single-stranded-DNA-specific exonuclease
MMRSRYVDARAQQRLLDAGLNPILSRVYAARGVGSIDAIEGGLERLLRPDTMLNIDRAADLLRTHIEGGRKILIVADYDCDGATACAVAIRGLRMMGANVDYLVPNRKVHGYGLTPDIVELALHHPRLGRPDLLMTVDNGIASIDGVEASNRAGIPVLVTDHHLPGDRLPDAAAILNPNQRGCAFPSKNLAGVGVMFYLLLALRRRYRDHQPQSAAANAPLQELLDLVALGTVADMVRLDENNRALVRAGLRRMRQGKVHAGVRALALNSGRHLANLDVRDLGFSIAPQINAAGRLEDIGVGIECLLADEQAVAEGLARQLDLINRQRKNLQAQMNEQALSNLPDAGNIGVALVVFQETWHEGVVGLLASKLKDKVHRPVLALAPSADPEVLRGSGRSIAGVHLRDAIDWVSKRAPDLLLRFGGHAMAAGFSIRRHHLAQLRELFTQAVESMADPEALQPVIWTDGPFDPLWLREDWIHSVQESVWGQGFPAPLFQDNFEVFGQRAVGGHHLRLALRSDTGMQIEAMVFNRETPLERRIRASYRMCLNQWQGRTHIQATLEHVEPC